MKNFVLVGTQRTGSSALAELIGFHPCIACGWEWTLRVARNQKILAAEKALAGDFSLLPEMERAYMNKILRPENTWLGFRRLFGSSDKWLLHPKFAPALWFDRLESHLDWLRSRPDIHIIHLRRDNNVAWLKSKYFSKKSGSYVGKTYPDDITIKVSLRESVARIKSKMWVDQRLSTLKDSNPYHQVWYEDFSNDKIAATFSIYQFLGCDEGDVSISMDSGRKRQSSGPLSKGILNYSELVSLLQSKHLLRSGRTDNSGT